MLNPPTLSAQVVVHSSVVPNQYVASARLSCWSLAPCDTWNASTLPPAWKHGDVWECKYLRTVGTTFICSKSSLTVVPSEEVIEGVYSVVHMLPYIMGCSAMAVKEVCRRHQVDAPIG